MRQNQYLATLTAAAALMFGVQARAAIIEVGTAQGAAGSTAVLSVSLNSEGAEVAGTQNDIAFPADAPVAARANGRPDCTASVKMDGSQFAFQPPGCTGTACTGIRAIIISFSDLSPIPTGSVLYTCNVAIASTATGTQALTCSGAGASDPDGGAITSTCTNGSVVVGGELPTNTPTATPTEGAGGTTIQVGSVTGNVGQADLTFTTSLETDAEVAGTQNDITFSGGVGAEITIPARANGRPDCEALVKMDGSQFAFQPPGCTGEACTGIRAIIISFSDLSPIPTGSELYRCKIQINGGETGNTFPLTCSGAGASDPDGGALPATCTNGTVTIGQGGGTPTASPTATTSGVVNTPTVTRTGGVNTPTRTVSVVPTAPFNVCDDGCAITSPADAHTGWLLLLPAAMLIWLRRRSR